MLEKVVRSYIKEFFLTVENLSQINEQIGEELIRNKATRREALLAELLTEEMFMRLRDGTGVERVRILLKRRLGRLVLELHATGAEFNPLIEVTDFNEDDEDYYRTMILKANRAKLSRVWQNGENVVTISVREAGSKQIYYTLAGMALGVIFGLVAKEILPPEYISAFDENVIESCRTVFLNALNMMIAPVIFFSVISGVTSISNAADIGRIGGKLLGVYTFTTLAASFLSVATGFFIFSGEVPQIGTPVGDAGAGNSFSLLEMFVGLVPKNLIAPIVNSEMLQIIFMAVVFGICINSLGDTVKILREIIDAMNTFCLKMISMIVKFIPFIAFLSMAALIFHVGMDSVLVLGKLVAGQFFGSLLMVGVYVLLTLVAGRLNPLPFLKKIPKYLPIPLSTSSSNAAMPFTLRFCTEKMGVSEKLSSFSIPVGATVNMDGGCFYLSIASIMLARMYGVELNFDVLFTIFVTVVALSIGAPGVPGGAFVCLASIVAALGLPKEAAAVVLGIDPICSMLRAALNAVGDISATTVLACNENLIDKKIYFAS